MYLVLGSSADASATWACQGLRERGLAPLEWVSLEALAGARRWEHRVGAAGAALEVTLADGRELSGARVRGVLNRLVHAPGAAALLAHPADRDYAGQELAAFFLSWLHALPGPMLNRPTPRGLCGAWRHASEWLWLAARAGLPTPAYRQSSADDGRPGAAPAPGAAERSVYVVAGEVVGEVPGGLAGGCRKLAELAGGGLLGVTFRAAADGCWTFARATPCPDLVPGGGALLDALARALGAEGGGAA